MSCIWQSRTLQRSLRVAVFSDLFVCNLSITINHQKVFKRVMDYKRMRVIHYDSSLYLYIEFSIIKRRLILHIVMWYTLPFFLQVYHTTVWHILKLYYNVWSLSEATYLQISSIWQPRIRQRSFTVFIEISLPCFNLWRVLWDIWYLLVKVYQFSFDFSNVFQNGE